MNVTKTPTGYHFEPLTSDEAQALEELVESLRSEMVEVGSNGNTSDCSEPTREHPCENIETGATGKPSDCS